MLVEGILRYAPWRSLTTFVRLSGPRPYYVGNYIKNTYREPVRRKTIRSCVFRRMYERPSLALPPTKKRPFGRFGAGGGNTPLRSVAFTHYVRSAERTPDIVLSRAVGERQRVADSLLRITDIPTKKRPFGRFGAGGGNRTPDLVITNHSLYRLSHTSKFNCLLSIANNFAIVKDYLSL